jgi:hypothetical protein
MYTLVQHLRSRQSLLVEVPALALSIVIAEVFYKFRSFTLECLCFLATWFALSALFSLALRRFARPGAGA